MRPPLTLLTSKSSSSETVSALRAIGSKRYNVGTLRHSLRTNSGFSQEFRLLIACGRAHLGTQDVQQVSKLLSEKLDWAYLLETAQWHGLKPLLYWHLSESCAAAVPKPVLQRLEGDFQYTAHVNLLKAAHLIEILELFRQYEITAIPYKGPVLAVQLYKNLALREFSDLDILVGSEDVLRAKEVLLAKGYRRGFDFTPFQERELLRSGCEYNFYSADGLPDIEIHWQIAPRSFSILFDPGRYLGRLRTVSLGGSPLKALSPEDLLLVLSVHAAKHLWRSLNWIVDIAELVRNYSALDWDLVFGEARSLGAMRVLLLGLYLARDLMDAPLSETVQKVSTDANVPVLAQRVYRDLRHGIHRFEPDLADHLFIIRMRERWRDKTFYVARTAFTPGIADWSWMNLPPSLNGLYPVVKLLRISANKFRLVSRKSGEAQPAGVLFF